MGLTYSRAYAHYQNCTANETTVFVSCQNRESRQRRTLRLEDALTQCKLPFELTFPRATRRPEAIGCRTPLLRRPKDEHWLSVIGRRWRTSNLSRIWHNLQNEPLSQHSPVFLISPELWLEITGYLRLWEQGSLSLTCHLFLDMFGPQYLKLNKPQVYYKIERLYFLESLDREFPKHRLCFGCATFHLGFRRCCWESQAGVPIYPRLTLQFRDVQLVAKAYRYNICTERFAETHYDASRPSGYGRKLVSNRNWKHSVSYTFVEGHLLLRIDSFKDVFSGIELTPFEDCTMCRHYGSELLEICSCAVDHIQYSLGLTTAISCPKCRPLRRCHSCPTEYLVRLDRCLSDRSIKLRVSRWSDLGDCRAPFTTEWRRATSSDFYPRNAVFDIKCTDTIRNRFETSCGRQAIQESIVPLHA